jgi:hypothetical protein
MIKGPERRPHRPHLDPGRVEVVRLRRLGPAVEERRAAPAGGRGDATTPALPGADTTVLEDLASAPIRSTTPIAYASNAAYLVELEATDPRRAGQPLRAVYKPASGERPLWDFPRRTLHRRERAAYLVSAALGADVVPPTVLRDGPRGPGSLQLFIHARRRRRGQADPGIAPQILRLAMFDVLANNADRKSAHLILDADDHLWGIDNALTFLPYPRQRTVLLELGGGDLAASDLELVRRLRDGQPRAGLRAALGELLSQAEVRAFEARLEELAEHPWYPVLDDWDGRPFEWW